MLLDAWRLALGTLTAIPVAPPALVDRRRAGMAMALAPLAAAPLAVAVTVVLVLGLQAAGLAACLASPQPVRAAVLAGWALCVSRAALATCCARGVPSARPGGLGDTYTGTVALAVVVLMWLTCAAVLSLAGAWSGLAWWRGALASATAFAVGAVVVARAVRRLGGVTGDVFGAAIELSLAALLVALS
jgi:adenosylcobinamide-GDP ribazoletransferase